MININNFRISKDEYFDIKIALFSKETGGLVHNADLNKHKSFFELLDALVLEIDVVKNLTDLLNNYYLKFTKFPIGLAKIKQEKESLTEKKANSLIKKIENEIYNEKNYWLNVEMSYKLLDKFNYLEKSFNQIFVEQNKSFKDFDENFKFEYILALSKAIVNLPNVPNEYIQYVAKNLFYTSVGFYEENNQTEELFETVNKILIDNSEEVLSKSDFVYYLNRETEEVNGFNLTFTKTSLYK